MRSTTRTVSAHAFLALLFGALAGCAPPGTGSTATLPPVNAASAATTETASTDAPPTPAITILEDAGLEVDLTPGTYTSRVFEPTIVFNLGQGWFRRDDVRAREFNLRRAPDGADVLQLNSGTDFLQCGGGDVVVDPSAAAIVEAITTSEPLHVSASTPVPVGDRTGAAIRLIGDGEPLTDDDRFGSAPEYGCVLTSGDEPWPAEAGWTFLSRDTALQLVIFDVEGVPVIVRAVADADRRDAHYDLVLGLLGTMQLD